MIDTSLYEGALAWMVNPLAAFLASGQLPVREGSGAAQIVPYQAYKTRDGWIMVLAGNDNLFRRMCNAIGMLAFADDERFRTNGARVVNRKQLIPLLEEVIARDTAAAWRERFDAVGV